MISLAKYLESAELAVQKLGRPWTVEDNDAAIESYETMRASERQHSAEGARGETTVDKSLMGLPTGWKVSKQSDGSVKVYMPSADGFVEVDTDAVDSLMARMAGKGETLYPTPANPASNFPTETVPMAGDGRSGGPLATPYENTELGESIMFRAGLPSGCHRYGSPQPFHCQSPPPTALVR